MATTATPYGLVPVKKADGTPYAGARESFLINAASYNVNIGYGSVVILKDGYVQLSVNTGSTNNTNNFPANTADATAYVVTDPGVTFQAQCDAAVAQAFLGRNTFFASTPDTNDVNTTTGKSTLALDATAVDTTAGFKIVGFSTRAGQSAVGDAFTDVLVKFNNSYHAFANGDVTS